MREETEEDTKDVKVDTLQDFLREKIYGFSEKVKNFLPCPHCKKLLRVKYIDGTSREFCLVCDNNRCSYYLLNIYYIREDKKVEEWTRRKGWQPINKDLMVL